MVVHRSGLDPDWDDSHLTNTALDPHGDDPEFGYRGSQRRSRMYVMALKTAGLTGGGPWRRVGTDNAAMESSFSLLQKNVLNSRRWYAPPCEDLRLAVVVSIERT